MYLLSSFEFDISGDKTWKQFNLKFNESQIDQGQESHTFYTDRTGIPDIRQKIFEYVKELSPDTLLFLNDYGILEDKWGRFELFQEQVRGFLDSGTPIDAIGLQSHFKVGLISYAFMRKCVVRGSPHMISNFWVGRQVYENRISLV